MMDADGGTVSGRRVARRTRVVSGDGFPTTPGFAAYEQAQGPGLVGMPVEAYKWAWGSNVLRQTSADRDQVFADGTFTKTTLRRSALDHSQEDTSGNLTIEVPSDHEVAQLFVSYNPATPVTLTIWRKHRGDAEESVWFVGEVLTVTFEGITATITCGPLSHRFGRSAPALVYQAHCNWALYGAGCGLNRELFKSTGTVLAVSASQVRAAVFATKPDGYFTNGWAETADGTRRFIVDHVGDTITLQPAFAALSFGATIYAFAGCDRTRQTCQDKFDNLLNHLGFPWIPTRNPYDGSLV